MDLKNNTQKNISISVITVVRNGVNELEQTINSVKSQSYHSIEYILVDGGSTDGTLDIINKYSDSFNFWCSEKDNGIYDAMNKGIEKATSDFMIFMNAGDTFASPSTVEQFIFSLPPDNKYVDLAYGDAILVNREGKNVYKKARNHRYVWYGMFAVHQAIFFSTKTIANLRYDARYKVGGDYALVSKICSLKQPPKILKLNFPICIFKEGGFSYTKNGMEIGHKEYAQIKKEILGQNNFTIALIDIIHRFRNNCRS